MSSKSLVITLALASFIVLGALGLLAGTLLYRVVSPDGAWPEERFRVRDTLSAYRPLIAHQRARLLQLSNLLRAIGWGSAMTYLSAFMLNVHGLSLRDFGYVAIVAGSGYFLGTRLGDGRFSLLSLRSMFALSTTVMGMVFAVIFVVPADLWMIVPPLILAVAAGGIGFVALTILIAEESPAGPATTMMLRQSGFSLGLAGGGAAGGLALATGGYDLLGLGVLAFAIGSSLVLYWPVPAETPAPPEPAPEPATSS